jgi:hypothetical protein
MSVNLIITGIFCVLLIMAAFLYRNSTLDKMPLLPGEKILFEEGGVRVEQSGSPRSVIFINCIVRVTDMRIIIAQKMLLSKKYALRHLIAYNGLSGSTDLKTSFKQGYLNIAVTKSDVKISDAGGICTVSINIPETALTQNQYITYKTSGGKYYSGLI